MPSIRALHLLILAIMLSFSISEGRYMPTRSDSNQLDRLSELLRNILEMSEPTGNGGGPLNSGSENFYSDRSKVPSSLFEDNIPAMNSEFYRKNAPNLQFLSRLT